MKPNRAGAFLAGLLLFGFPAKAQTPPPQLELQATIGEAVEQARSLRKAQESLAAALAAKRVSREMRAEQISTTEKTWQSVRDLIDKIDEQYESLSQSKQSAVREAWSLAKIFGVFVEYLKTTAAQPDSPDRDKELISNTTSTTRRATMLEESLTQLVTPAQPPRPRSR